MSSNDLDKNIVLDSETFSSVLGQAAWLMTLSPKHKKMPISTLETEIAPALLLRQFKLASKEKQPVAFLTWAAVSNEILEKVNSGYKLKDLKEWRSGENIIVVDCICPFFSEQAFVQKFLSNFETLKNQGA